MMALIEILLICYICAIVAFAILALSLFGYGIYLYVNRRLNKELNKIFDSAE